MFNILKHNKNINIKCLKIFLAVCLLCSQSYGLGASSASAQSITLLNLPTPGVRLGITSPVKPLSIKGIKIFPENPLRFDFIVDLGDSDLKENELEQESQRLINYFLASLTVPEDDMWVNLSPIEEDRVIPQALSETEMGRDLLIQDYVLKQMTASLLYPEEELGESFWDAVYEEAYERYGITDIPVETFNKVWIVPEKAVIYVNDDIAYVVESHLKVMLEKDYMALKELGVDSQNDEFSADFNDTNQITSELAREIIIPKLEKEVNEGSHFLKLRQIYSSLILATWFKKNLRDSFLGREYVDHNKIPGIDIEDKKVKEKVFEQYMEAYKKGVFEYIKDDYDDETQQVVSRKYFSGGIVGKIAVRSIEEINVVAPEEIGTDKAMIVSTNLQLDSGKSTPSDKAQLTKRIVIASTNAAKIAAWKEYFEDHDNVKILTLEDVGLSSSDVKEPASVITSFKEKALFKANGILNLLKMIGEDDVYVIAEDSGIEVENLGGAPGVNSEFYALGDTRYEDLYKESPPKAVMKKIFDQLNGVPRDKRVIYSAGYMALVSPEGQADVRGARVQGKVPEEIDLSNFDPSEPYLPLIEVDGARKLFSEMSQPEKRAYPSTRQQLLWKMESILDGEVEVEGEGEIDIEKTPRHIWGPQSAFLNDRDIKITLISQSEGSHTYRVSFLDENEGYVDAGRFRVMLDSRGQFIVDESSWEKKGDSSKWLAVEEWAYSIERDSSVNIVPSSYSDFVGLVDKRMDDLKRLNRDKKYFTYYRDAFLVDVILDFVGYGEPASLLDKKEEVQRLSLAKWFLTKIYANPAVKKEFKSFIDTYEVQITDRNRNAPLFLAAANFLKGRAINDRDIVRNVPFLKQNKEIVDYHSWYGETDIAKLPIENRILIPGAVGAEREKVKVLLIGAAEKPGSNKKALYLKDILNHPSVLGQNVDIEIVVTDIRYQEEYFEYNEETERFNRKKAFDFSHGGNEYEEDGVRYRLVDMNSEFENIVSSPDVYDSSEKFDVVINARVAIQYFRTNEMLYNMRMNSQKHLKEGGLLIYDGPDSERADLYYKHHKDELFENYATEDFGVEYVGAIPFRDPAQVLNDKNAIQVGMGGIESPILMRAYDFALKFIGEGDRRVVYKRALINLLSEVVKDQYYLASILLYGVDIEKLKAAGFSDAILRQLLVYRSDIVSEFEFIPQKILDIAYKTDGHKAISFWKGDRLKRYDELPKSTTFYPSNEVFNDRDQITIVEGSFGDGNVVYKVENKFDQRVLYIEARDDGESRVDRAMLRGENERVGGIDLNPSYFNLEVQGEGGSYYTRNPFEEAIEFDGLTPFIFQIMPVTNLPQMLGCSLN